MCRTSCSSVNYFLELQWPSHDWAYLCIQSYALYSEVAVRLLISSLSNQTKNPKFYMALRRYHDLIFPLVSICWKNIRRLLFADAVTCERCAYAIHFSIKSIGDVCLWKKKEISKALDVIWDAKVIAQLLISIRLRQLKAGRKSFFLQVW